MQRKHTRRGETQNNHLTNCHSRGLLSGISSTLKHTRWGSPIKTLGDDAYKYVGMRANWTTVRNGFTLIVLLVVVLIFGILAAVAVPQYQKAVYKSRWKYMDVIMNLVEKQMAMHQLSGGSSTVYFTGKNSVSEVDFPGDCSSQYSCYNNEGGMSFNFQNGGNYYVQFFFYSLNNGRATHRNPLIPIGTVTFFNEPRNETGWVLSDGNGNPLSVLPADKRRVMCQWLQDRGYSVSGQSLQTKCSEIGVNVKRYSSN